MEMHQAHWIQIPIYFIWSNFRGEYRIAIILIDTKWTFTGLSQIEILLNYIEASICVVAIGLTPNHISIQWEMSNIPRSAVFLIDI